MNPKSFGFCHDLAAKHRKELEEAQLEWRARQANPEQIPGKDSNSDIVLLQKWVSRVGKDWYGFDVGDIPPAWTQILDEFFTWLEIQCPDFQIHQVKIKAGSLRINVGTKTSLFIPDNRIRAEISGLHDLLQLHEDTPSSTTPQLGARRKQSKAHDFYQS